MNTTRKLLQLFIAVIMLLSFTACSRDLSREKALQLLQKNKQEEVTETIIYGGRPVSVYSSYEAEQESRRLAEVESKLQGLRNGGFLSYEKRSGFLGGYTQMLICFDITCNSELDKYAVNDTGRNILKLTLAKPTVKEVTGITKVSDNERIVQYTLELNPTPLYSAVGGDVNLKREAKFRLFDDGWRMEE